MMTELETVTAVAMFAASCCYVVVMSRKERPLSSASTIPSDDHGTLSKQEILRLRRKHFSSSLSVSYANSNPLLIVKVSEMCILQNDAARIVMIFQVTRASSDLTRFFHP